MSTFFIILTFPEHRKVSRMVAKKLQLVSIYSLLSVTLSQLVACVAHPLPTKGFPLYLPATWSTRKYMPFVMQRISVAVQIAAASEIRLAMGVGQATAVA